MSNFLQKPNWKLVAYIVFLQFELSIIRRISDLNAGTSNWIEKANQILQFQIPADNFYGPGAALLMTPFVLIGTSTYLANHFYFALGAIAFWYICSAISSKSGRVAALFALPANIYLIWLIDSSQDTVFEFFLLSWSLYFLSRKRIGLFVVTGFILCQTRAGYWVFYLGVSGILFVHSYVKHRKIAVRKLFAVYALLGSSLFNYINYDSPSPALEGGLTAYFGYTKYHYLALPKMDMDVFLSGPNGAFSAGYGPAIPKGSSPAEVNSIYLQAAIDSAWENKEETVLGWMQKFDSYFFDVQKIPHLPGQYVLNQDEKIILIGEERLNWNLVAGNAAYMIYRSALIVTGFIALGLLLGFALLYKRKLVSEFKLILLALPFIFGAVPGILIYTETRFKIVSELMLVPLIFEIWTKALQERKMSKRIS